MDNLFDIAKLVGILVAVAGIFVGPFGAAWVGVRTSLNGFKKLTEERFDTVDETASRIETKVDQINGRVRDHGERVAVLEARDSR